MPVDKRTWDSVFVTHALHWPAPDPSIYRLVRIMEELRGYTQCSISAFDERMKEHLNHRKLTEVGQAMLACADALPDGTEDKIRKGKLSADEKGLLTTLCKYMDIPPPWTESDK